MTTGPDASDEGAPDSERDPRMVPNFQAELEEMHDKMREHLKIGEPPPAIVLWRPDRSDFQVFTWPSPWLH